MQRTYSRKRNQRRSLPQESTLDEQPSPEQTPVRPRKRQKIEVEVIASSLNTGDEPSSRNGSASVLHNTSARARTPTSSTNISPPPVTPRRTLTRTVTTSVIEQSPTSPSPRKAVRDLSSIFSFAADAAEEPSLAPPSTRSNVTRRMLGRSHTETSIISISSSSEKESVDGAGPTVYGTPRKLRAFVSESAVGSPSSREGQSPSKPVNEASSPPKRPSLLVNANVRTYAGNSRSFLVALPPSQAASLGMGSALVDDPSAMLAESQEDDFDIRESYTELRHRWGVDASEDDPRPHSPQPSPSPKRKGKAKGLPKQNEPPRLLSNGMMNDLKSITELRSKGESRRFLDEVGYLFEGLEAQGALGVRRGSAMEIVTKLCDVEFARRAKAADFLGRTWDVLREAGAGDGDKVLDSILAFFAALVARDPTDLLDFAGKSDFTSTLHGMLASLEHSNDPLWLISTNAGLGELKAAGIAKAEITLLGNLQRLVRKRSGIFDENDTVSNRLLISQALVTVSPSAHTSSQLPSLVRSLTLEAALFPSRVAAYASGLSLFPPEGSSAYLDTPSMLHLDQCLRLLDSFLLGSWSASGDETTHLILDKLREGNFLKGLIALCVSCMIIIQDDRLESHRVKASKCIESALRVLINLTHDDAAWCRALFDRESSLPTIMQIIIIAQRQRRILEKRIEAEEDDTEDADISGRALDRLCLALGVLTNVVQAMPDAKHRIGDTLLDYDCRVQRRCLRECTCPSRASALTCLAQVYTHYVKSQSEVDAVVRGHMAVLFGLLMELSPVNQQILLSAIPGENRRVKLGTLLQHAQDFTLFYVTLTRKMAEVRANGEEEDDDDDDESLPMASPSGGVFHDSKGEAVAKSVVALLKRLRDEAAL